MSTQIAEFDSLMASVTTFVAPVRGITVTDAATNAVAAGTLRTIKDLMKQVENKRVEAVGPMNERVKQINSYAKDVAAPLVEAEGLVKGVMAAWAKAEAVKAEEARKQAEEERRRIEEDARAARLKAEQEAEARRLIAQAEEDRRRKAEEDERRAMAEKQHAETRAAAMFGVTVDTETEQKALEEKQRAEKERLRAEAAKIEQERLAEEARIERERKERENALRAQAKAIEANRPKNTRQVPKWEISDPALVPKEFWVIDQQKIGASIRGGVREIPGVKIWMETEVVAR